MRYEGTYRRRASHDYLCIVDCGIAILGFSFLENRDM